MIHVLATASAGDRDGAVIMAEFILVYLKTRRQIAADTLPKQTDLGCIG